MHTSSFLRLAFLAIGLVCLNGCGVNATSPAASGVVQQRSAGSDTVQVTQSLSGNQHDRGSASPQMYQGRTVTNLDTVVVTAPSPH